MTRIGPDGEPHPLKAVDTVQGPDEYRYYDRGHVYFSIPPLGEKVAVRYRFEYELIGAVTPAWAIAAGPGSRASDEQELFWPWERVGHVVADWRRAWPALTTRYRFDHDVLLPSREGPGYTIREVDYDLEYDNTWRDITPTQDVGAATPGAYRAHKVFDYLGSGIPPQATTAPAALRLASLAALPIGGTLGWLLVMAAARRRRGPPIDRTFVDTRILTRAPEEIAFWLEDKRPVVADVLARLAGEAAISIHADRPAGHTFEEVDEHAPVRLHMRRVAADASLTAFERDILDDVFGDARELTTESHRQRHAGRDYDPDEALEARLRSARQGKGGATPGSAKAAGRRWTPARVGLMLVFVFGLVNVFRYAGPLGDIVPILAIWAFLTVALVNGMADRLVVSRTPGARTPRPAGGALRAAVDAAADPEPAAAGGRVGGIGDRGAGRLLPHARAFPPASGRRRCRVRPGADARLRAGGAAATASTARRSLDSAAARPGTRRGHRGLAHAPQRRGGDAARARRSAAHHDRALHRDVAGAVGRPEGVGHLARGATRDDEDDDDEADGDEHAAADAGAGRDEDRS